MATTDCGGDTCGGELGSKCDACSGKCGHVIYGMGPCVLDADHRTLHMDEDGTEFSHSGKIGLGKIGPNMRAAWDRLRDR